MAPLPQKLAMTARVKPTVKREIERLAKRAGEHPSRFMSDVLEHYINGCYPCRSCGLVHPQPECSHAN